jgi:hypothetical protein
VEGDVPDPVRKRVKHYVNEYVRTRTPAELAQAAARAK